MGITMPLRQRSWTAMAAQTFLKNQKFALSLVQSLWFPWMHRTPTVRSVSRQFNRTASRVEAAKRLSQRARLDHLVDFVHGDAAAMPLPASRYDAVIGQESWLHIPDKTALISECVRVLKPGGTVAFTDIVARSRLDPSTEARLAAEMHTSNIASAESYAALLERKGCSVVAHDDLSDDWKEILVKRLEMYRSLRDTTIARFGDARFLEYDKAYSHFVGCFLADKLGGVRIAARKPA
jgi:SAM-dependent methyltransferase